MQRIEQASQLELDELGEAELALQRAWCVAPLGNPDAVARISCVSSQLTSSVTRRPSAR